MSWIARARRARTAPSSRNVRPPVARVRAPTLILWGDRDRFLDRGLAEAAAALCDDARVVHMEKAGHWVQHEAAARVNRELAAFLSGGRPED